MTFKIPLTVQELEEHLKEQLEFLEVSAESYDSGKDGEAKRLASTIRVLVHESRTSHSLLGQLGRLNASFISTALPHSPENVSTHGGLVLIASAGKESKYIAMLDEAMHFDWLPFDDWWNQTVFVDDQKRVLSRKQLVLTAANQDGGAHIDPSLDETYANLSRNNSLNWVAVENGNEYSIPKPERAAIRQITHEVLRTLKPDYRMKPQYKADIVFGGAMIVKGSKAPETPRPKKIERNEQCPCGSGKKYKKCHGKQ